VSWVAVIASAAAVALWLPVRPSTEGPGPPIRVAVAWSLVGCGSATLAAAMIIGIAPDPHQAVVAAAVLGAALGAAALWRRRRLRVQAGEVSARVLESCELLISELAAGRPPGWALERAAAEWPDLDPVARAWRFGSDVPGAFRDAAGRDGAAELRLLAAAWQVGQGSGHSLAGAVSAIADDLRGTLATRRVVESELASARATARLVAVLPFPVLMMGGTAGSNPWAFLFGTPIGAACLAGGLVCMGAGLWWMETIAGSVWEGP
jgi:tight adherence protein B